MDALITNNSAEGFGGGVGACPTGKTLIVNLPGSPKAVQENLEYILPSLKHGVRIAAGLDGECARK